MPSSTNNFKTTKSAQPETVFRAQEILKTRLKIYSQGNDKQENFSGGKVYLNAKSKKFKILSRVSRNYLKRSLINISSPQPSKAVYFKAVKNFYKGYKLSLYTALFLLNLKVINNFNKLKKNYYQQRLISKYYFKLIYPKISVTKKINESFLKNLNFLINRVKKEIRIFKILLNLSYKKNLRLYSSSSILVSLFYKLDNSLLNFFYNLKQIGLDQINSLKLEKQFTHLIKKLEGQLNNFNQFITKSKTILLQILSLDKKQINSLIERVGLIFAIYFLPFVFLATQALVPLIDEYEYLIVNPVTSSIFSKIPLLIDLIKWIRPLITNPMLLFWVPLAYYLTFTSAYRSLKISYKVAYNGTIAAIFLIINYSCVLMQFMMKLAFDSIKIIKDIFFTSYLIKHLGKNKNKERDEALKVFANLVSRYDSELRKNYYDFLLLINHRIFSHLALISLAALVYNCIYYIIHNKNPEIILVTKTALATIKNPQEEE